MKQLNKGDQLKNVCFSYNAIASSFFTNHGYIRCVALELTLSWNTIRILLGHLLDQQDHAHWPQYMTKLKLQCCVMYTSNLWITKMYII